MKKVCIFGIFLISFFLLIFPKRIQAQGTCTAQKNLATQTCELDQNNCQNYYIPWVHEVNNICDCDCVSDPNNPPPTPTPQTGNGAQCMADGGTCRNNCYSGEEDRGIYDCGFGVGHIQQRCCFPATVTPPKKSCGESCVSAGQCPSQCPACQVLVQSQGKVCRVAGGITPAPGPGGGAGGSIRTAIGDIDPRNLQGFVQQLLNLAFGVAGGVAFLLMLFGVFQVMTSGGNPEKMKSGSELITSALTGLLFIVFSIFILKLVGVQILEIPGFGQ